MRIVLIPGWNEGADKMQVFVNGRHGYSGLRARGFECALFDGGRGSLFARIDQLAEFVAGVRAATEEAERIALFGYSAGGVVARGLLKKYPDVCIASVFQLAAPNAGIVTDGIAGLFHRPHFSQSELEDLDLESDFMQWLNGTLGQWVSNAAPGDKHWKLESKPWAGPPGKPIFNLAGRVPRYGYRSDGVVLVDSATLDGHIDHDFLDGKGANHLNLSGAWNVVAWTVRGWRGDDTYWPRVVDRAARFFEHAF